MVLGEVARPSRSRAARGPADRALARFIPAADADYHWAQAAAVDKAFVLGFRSRYLSADIPNRYVADYVNKFPQKLIGFAGIDPTERSAAGEVRVARSDMGLRGVTLSPANQDFHPSDTRAMRVYEMAEELGMPVLIHPGSPFAEQSKMEFARPFLLDEVARTFPRLRMVVAQLGHPFIEETICLLGKHPHIYAEVSGLLKRPWQAYNALVSAYQYGVIDKLLFGSDFPYTNPTECIESLYNLNQMAHGTNMPIVPRESLRCIVERDALALLGLA
jgi:predicted TIM-barrel fold metal-dependent hydrolase